MESKALFFYVGSDNVIRPNPGLMPLSVISKFHGAEGPYLRFAYDPSDNKFYIQDDTFRAKLATGEDAAWDLMNHALGALDKTHGARFVIKAYGDPLDSSVWRKTSDYVNAWRDIVDAIRMDFGVHAIQNMDYPVYEYVPMPEQKDETVSLAKPGEEVGGRKVDTPVIKINRMLHRSSNVPCTSGDVDYNIISMFLKVFYLQKLAEEAKKLAPDTSEKTMFAIRDGDKTRIFNSKDDDDGMPFDDGKIRETIKHDGPILTFCLDKSNNRLVIKNAMLSALYNDPTLSAMLEDVSSGACKACGVQRHQLSLACDHSMGQGFASKLSRYEPLWAFSSGTPGKIDMDVLEAPIKVKGGVAIAHNIKDEESAATRSVAFRSSKGMNLSYPIMIVDSRTPSGRKLRMMMDAYLGFFGDSGEEPENDDFEFAVVAGHPGFKARARVDMEVMLSLGYGRREVLDFFAPKGDGLRRYEYGKILREAMEAMEGRTVTAAMGKGLNTNEWYHALQENLNQSSHTNDKNKAKHQPFNVKRRNTPPMARNYEQLLMSKHDLEMNYQKGMEQLLRESQI